MKQQYQNILVPYSIEVFLNLSINLILSSIHIIEYSLIALFHG